MKSIVIDNIRFNSIKDACNFYGTPYKTYQSRIQSGQQQIPAITGIGLEDKRKLFKHPNHKTPITVDGVMYPSIKSACNAAGISYMCFARRVQLGHSKEYALSKSFHSVHSPWK